MEPRRNSVEPTARRAFLRSAGLGLGGLALADLMGLAPGVLAQSVSRGIFGTGHVAARAKRVILLHHMGAVSQVDTFDYKPTLIERHGEEMPDSVRSRVRISAMSNAQASFPLVRPLAEFSQAGQSGAWVSDLLPYTREIVDDLCFIKTLHTEHVNHDPAAKFLHTGYQLSGRPSMGAWLDYALGSDNANLPSFVAMVSAGTPAGQGVDGGVFGSGFLPSHHQGVLFSSGEQPVPYISNPEGVTLDERREQLDLVNALARLQHDATGDPEIPSKIAQYEMAYRMQSAVPEVADLASEPQHILDMYGPNVLRPGSFARNCLLARRLVERDVKFVSLINTGWDHHNGNRRIASRGLPARRSAIRRARERPQAARPAGGHAGDLGQRIRAHGVRPGRAQRRLRARSSRRLLHVLDGGGRRQRRPFTRRDRRVQLQHRPRSGVDPRSARDGHVSAGYRS